MEIHIRPSQVSTICFQREYTMATSLRLNHRSSFTILPSECNRTTDCGISVGQRQSGDKRMIVFSIHPNTYRPSAPTTPENNIIWKVFILDYLYHVILWFHHVNFAVAWIISAATAGLVGHVYSLIRLYSNVNTCLRFTVYKNRAKLVNLI